MKNNKCILLIDLNNEASYPTLAIGYLLAPLKAAGFHVDVFSPLTDAVKLLARDRQETYVDYAVARIHFAASPVISWADEIIHAGYNALRFRPTIKLKKRLRETLNSRRYDAILVSCYLQYYQHLVFIAKQAQDRGIPLLLGGPYFNHRSVVEEWSRTPGVTAIFGGEADHVLPRLVDDLIDSSELEKHPGIFLRKGGLQGDVAPPLDLSHGLRVPDFDQFDWGVTPHRVLPVMTGRGCSWGRCTFCSDVTTASTRTFRSRPLQSVLDELKIQSSRYATRNFIFFDSKLNSDLMMWYGIIDRIQNVVPGARWVASVHVDGKGENGLDVGSLRAAFSSGLRRISFGLETGSQWLNKRMLKGTDVDRTSKFVEDAHDAGISVRTTIILGYPGERIVDIQATSDFLATHFEHIDRVKLSKFKAIPGTLFQKRIDKRPELFPSVRNLIWDNRYARAKYDYRPEDLREYRQEKAKLLKIVHRINRKQLKDSAKQFNGLM